MNEKETVAQEFARFKKVTVLMYRQQLMKKYELEADDGRLVLMATRWLQDVTVDDPLFGVWLAARHDAKPVIDAYERSTHVGKAWTYANAWGGMTFKTHDEAVKHALERGFRLKGAAD